MASLDIELVPLLKDNYAYLLHDSATGTTAVVDPSEARPVLAVARARGWRITHVLSTHHHWDHTGGNLEIKQATDCMVIGPGYDQDAWVRSHGYHELPWLSLIDTWRQHNALLVQMVKRIPEERLAAPCVIGGASPVTLGFVIEDYILHMQHHLDHILGREKITQYPGAAAAI